MNQIEYFVTFTKYVPAIIWSFMRCCVEWLIPKSWIAKDVSEDIVLITGAGSGLGRDLAVEYAKSGSCLVLWDINVNGLEETKGLVEQEQLKYSLRLDDIRKKKNGAEGSSALQADDKLIKFCLTYIVDVSDKLKIRNGAQKVYEDLNKDQTTDQREKYVTVLINNAGIYHGLLLNDLRDDQIERIFNINVLAHFWTVRAFLPNMIKNGKGHIVEIVSMGAILGMLKQVDYCAAKYATLGFEESLSIELDYLGLSDKIQTTAICPFFFSSNLFTGFNEKVTPIMTSTYVAEQTVLAMRCNYTRYMIPTFQAYVLYLFKSFAPRQAIFYTIKALGLGESIRNIKGAAAAS